MKSSSVAIYGKLLSSTRLSMLTLLYKVVCKQALGFRICLFFGGGGGGEGGEGGKGKEPLSPPPPLT